MVELYEEEVYGEEFVGVRERVGDEMQVGDGRCSSKWTIVL